MNNFRFQSWCRKAVSKIVLVQDRITVGREIYQHIEDQYYTHLNRGNSPDEAEKYALDAMGDPEELSLQLGIIHRPLEGYLYLITRKMLTVLLCILVLTFSAHLLVSYVLHRNYEQPVFQRYHPYEDTFFDNSLGQWSLTYRTEPETGISTDGYTFTLTDAAQWHGVYTDSTGQVRNDDYFHFRITVTNPRPWAEFSDVVRWFWAEDSLGNRYQASYEHGDPTASYIWGSIYHTKPLTYVCDMQLENFVSQDAEWIDLHYDRGNRDFAVRIDLTGGNEA